MDDEGLKKILEAIKDGIRPVKELVEVLKSKVDKLEFFQTSTNIQKRSIKEQQSAINEKLDELKASLDTNTVSIIQMEATLKAYGDMYNMNNDIIQKLDKRMNITEEELDINPPQELILGQVKDLHIFSGIVFLDLLIY